MISSFGAMATSFMSLKERLHGVVLQVTRARCAGWRALPHTIRVAERLTAQVIEKELTDSEYSAALVPDWARAVSDGCVQELQCVSADFKFIGARASAEAEHSFAAPHEARSRSRSCPARSKLHDCSEARRRRVLLLGRAVGR